MLQVMNKVIAYAIITAGKTRLHWQNKVSQRIKPVHFSFRILARMQDYIVQKLHIMYLPA